MKASWRTEFREAGRELWEVFFPWVCPACEDRCLSRDFCGCGKLMQAPRLPVRWIPYDFRGKTEVLPVYSLWKWSREARSLLHRIKYRGEFHWLLPWLRQAGAVVQALPLDEGATDARLVPIPSRATAWLKRGFHPAEEIANFLGKEWGIPVEAFVLSRLPGGTAQAGLTRTQRRHNIQGRFRARPNLIQDTEILLVDDVVTTGATLVEAAKAFLSIGQKKIQAWSLFQA